MSNLVPLEERHNVQWNTILCRPRTSIVTGSQLQLDLLTAKLKKLEEERAEEEAWLSSDAVPAEEPELPATKSNDQSAYQSPFEPESRRRVVGFQEEEQNRQSSDDELPKQKGREQVPHFEQRHGEESVLPGIEGNKGLESQSRSWTASQHATKEQSLQKLHSEPERLPQAVPEKDGRFVLKGLERFKKTAGQSRAQKLESFDRRIGRQPNAIREVSLCL